MQAYRAVLRIRDVRRVLFVSFFLRVPMWAGNVVLTLHIVTHLHRSYGAAGILDGIVTVGAALSGPWRGRRLDRVGLRRTVAPSLVVLVACWAIAPFLDYWALLGLASVAALFIVPSFSIARVALLHAVPDEHRTSALSIDSVMVELSFMIGPALGVLTATYWSTSWALFACEFAAVAAGALLWLMNPPTRVEPDEADTPPPRHRRWLTVPVAAVLGVCVAATLVLTGTDVGIVAALRHMGHQSWIGWELAVWGAGSALGGLVYGLLKRPVPVAVLITLLAGTTMPVIVAHEPFVLAALLFAAGLFCAPTVTATVDGLSRLVPASVRGEAMGWHASALTAGSAIGAPLAGLAIDAVGWRGAFVVAGSLGLVAAFGAAAALRGQRAADHPERPPDVPSHAETQIMLTR